MVLAPKLKVSQLRLLIVDADEGDATQLLDYLRAAGHTPQATRVTNAAALRAALETKTCDAVLCKHRQPGLTAFAAFKLMQELELDLPFLVIADSVDDRSAARALHAGAQDCFARDSLERLVPAIEREVRNARQRAELRAALDMLKDSDARFRALASNLPGMVFQLQRDANGDLRFGYVSEGCEKLIGIKHHELLASAQRFFDAIEASDRETLHKTLRESVTYLTTLNWEGRIRRRGKTKWINLRSTPQRLDSGDIQWQGIATEITRSKEAEAQLRRSREQLSELSYHLEIAKEEERERIARDIHDELGSTLFAVKTAMALLGAKLPAEPSNLREKAHAIDVLIDQAMSTARRVARELRPGILKEFGLPAAIEGYADDFCQRHGVDCRTTCDDDIELDEKTSLALFRIFQEALTNVAKHARATLVAVRLRRENGAILLEIRDNGRGISETDMNKPKSFGLRGIRERINSLNGEFIVMEAEQGGSILSMRVPTVRLPAAPAAIEESPQQSLF